MKKRWLGIYNVLFLSLCLIPFVGMSFAETTGTTENRKLAQLPHIRTEEGWNKDYLNSLGEYFEDHFAFRQELVTANAWILDRAFGVSSAQSVAAGTEGWLYYADSLDDYLGRDLLSERELYDIGHTLKMMQDQAEASGSQFLFTLAPNKNTLYGEHMPYYYQAKADPSRNSVLLEKVLEEEGVNYVNLFDAFSASKRILYHRGDSHWDNEGAALAASLLMDAAGMDHKDYVETDFETRDDFQGDLYKMLYPMGTETEEESYYKNGFTYRYIQEIASTFDPFIQTENGQRTGSLLMYRDSFGNALLPFMAEEFASGTFSRAVPYPAAKDLKACKPDLVIVERAERFLPELGKNPPVMECPSVLPKWEYMEQETDTSFSSERYGEYWKISGNLDAGFLDWNSRIYLQAEDGRVWEAFPVTVEGENGKREERKEGYLLYLPFEAAGQGTEVKVIVEYQGKLIGSADAVL